MCKKFFSTFIKKLSLWSEGQFVIIAEKKIDAKFFLQSADRIGNGWLCYKKFFGSLRDIVVSRSNTKIF